MNTCHRVLILTALAGLPVVGHAETPHPDTLRTPVWTVTPQLAQAAPWMREQWQHLAPQERDRLREELRQRERDEEARRERNREERRNTEEERGGDRGDKQGYGRGYEDRETGRPGGFGGFGSGGSRGR